MSGVYQEWMVLGNSSGLALGSTGDKLTIPVPFRCELREAFVVITGASTHATAGVVKFDHRPTAGSDTSRTDGTLGVCTKTLSVNQQGKHLSSRVSARQLLKPGEEVVVEVTTANGDACTFSAGILVERIAEAPANEPNVVVQ